MTYIVLDQCKVNCVLNFKANATSVDPKANLKNIFVTPYPTLFLWYGSVGRKIIFFNFSNSIPIKPNCKLS